MDEQEAVTQMKHGNINGLSVMVERYQLRAMRAAVLITRDAGQAEDIVQNAFIRAYQRIHQLDGSRSFGPWFLRIVVNDAIKASHKSKRFVHLENEQVFEDPFPGPQDVFDEKERDEMIREALEELSAEQRAVIVMRYYLDMDEREMASVADVPVGTIKWRLHAARRRLQGLLARWRHIATDQEG